MTLRYVRSGAGGAATGADWANAYLTLAAALTAAAAGDTIYVSEDHAETQASAMTLSSPGTLTAPVSVLCVDHLGSVPPVSADLRATATVTTTGTNTITFGNSANAGMHYNGIIFNSGTGAGAAQIIIGTASSAAFEFEDCSLRIVSTGAGKLNFPNGGTINDVAIGLKNTTLSFAGTGQGVNMSGARVKWRDTASALLGTIPTTLFDWSTGRGGEIECLGVDLSAAGAGKTIVGNSVGSARRVVFQDCKLNASVTKVAAPPTPGSVEVDFWRSGSAGVNYNANRTRYAGTMDEETTIVRTGGASDGTTPLAWKIVTTANASLLFPFESAPIAIWNDVDGSPVTATVEGIWGGGAVPNDDEIWLEVQYLGDNASPQGSFVNDSKADPLAAAAAQTASAETWGGSTTDFKLAVTFTPQQKGWVLARIMAAKASETFYIDPKVTLS